LGALALVMIVLVVMLFLVNKVLSKVAKQMELKLLKSYYTNLDFVKSISCTNRVQYFCFWQVRTLFTDFLCKIGVTKITPIHSFSQNSREAMELAVNIVTLLQR
jgi:hypothetical protein